MVGEIFARYAGKHLRDTSLLDLSYRDSARTWDVVTQTVCLTVTTLCIGMRMYTKLMILKTRGWEDLTCFAAWLGLIAYAVITIELDKHGNGIHIAQIAAPDKRQFAKLANASQIVYAPLIFITKLSIFLLYLRVFAPTRQGRTFYAIHLLIWFNLAFYLANFFLKIFQCTPRKKIWDKTAEGQCININIPILVAAAINVVSDVLMLSLPIVCVWRLQMSRRRKMGISAIFAAGFFGCFASVMRLQVSIRNRHTQDQTYDWYDEILWTTAEIACGIIASCLPACPTFFRTFSSRAKTIFPALSVTRGSDFSMMGQSVDKVTEAEMYELTQSRGRMHRLGHSRERDGSYHRHGRGIYNDGDEVFTGLTYAASEARAERSRTRVQAVSGHGSGSDLDDKHSCSQGILKTVEVDIESGPGSPRSPRSAESN